MEAPGGVLGVGLFCLFGWLDGLVWFGFLFVVGFFLGGGGLVFVCLFVFVGFFLFVCLLFLFLFFFGGGLFCFVLFCFAVSSKDSMN